MHDKISRREFTRMLARGGLLALLGYGVIKTVCRSDAGKGNAQCPHPGMDCGACKSSSQCRRKVKNFGKDS